MSERLIIDARRHLNWNRRLFSDASTLLLWSAWLWLCRSLLLRLVGTVGVALGVHRASGHLTNPGTVPSIEEAVFALLGTCSLLMLWNRLASQPAPTPNVSAVPDYAGTFGLSGWEIAEARASSICTVHHDEAGRILRIDTDRGELPIAA